MLHIKANEELFDRWRFLSSKISDLASIVQNDFLIHRDGLKVWENNANIAREGLSGLIEETLEYLNGFRE